MFETETFLHDWTGTIEAPLCLVENRVRGEWVDTYGHLNMAHYLTICDQSNWAFWNWVNFPHQKVEERDGAEYVIVENHITYGRELLEGDAFRISTQMTALDAKRYILFHRVLNADGAICATNEAKVLGFDLNARRPMNWRPEVAARLAEVLAAHKPLGHPDEAGKGIVLGRR